MSNKESRKHVGSAAKTASMKGTRVGAPKARAAAAAAAAAAPKTHVRVRADHTQGSLGGRVETVTRGGGGGGGGGGGSRVVQQQGSE